MTDNVTLRDFYGVAAVMRATDKTTSKVAHNITDDVSLVPIVSAGIVSSLIASAAPASLVSLDVTAIADGYLFIFDSAAVVADGTPPLTLPMTTPKKVLNGTNIRMEFRHPLKFANGISIQFSSTLNSGTGFALTASVNAVIAAQIAAATGEAS